MISIATLLLEYVCPIAGGITATIMFAAPLPDAYHAVREQGQLGSLNPLPWAFMLGNCYGWVLYGVIQRNFFVYCANVPGFLFAVWLNVQAVKLQYNSSYHGNGNYSPVRHGDKQQRDVQSQTASVAGEEEEQQQPDETVADPETPSPPKLPMAQDIWILFMVLIWLLLTSILGFQQGTLSPNVQQLLIGSAVNLNLVIFYAAPLSTIYTVLHTQSSASIHVPTMLTNTANGVFWCAYGLAVQDWFIAVPNGLGAVLGFTQIVLRVLFPVQTVQDDDDDDDVGEGGAAPKRQHEEEHVQCTYLEANKPK